MRQSQVSATKNQAKKETGSEIDIDIEVLENLDLDIMSSNKNVLSKQSQSKQALEIPADNDQLNDDDEEPIIAKKGRK